MCKISHLYEPQKIQKEQKLAVYYKLAAICIVNQAMLWYGTEASLEFAYIVHLHEGLKQIHIFVIVVYLSNFPVSGSRSDRSCTERHC